MIYQSKIYLMNIREAQMFFECDKVELLEVPSKTLGESSSKKKLLGNVKR